MPLSRTVAPYSPAHRYQPAADPWAQAASTAFHTSYQPHRVDLLAGAGQNPRHEGPGNKDAGLAMVFKLLEAAEGRWRAVNGPHLVALVRAGARFEKGRLVERPKEAPKEDINEVAA
jgi:hypothetical protein